jgi:hypothetical protein
MKKKYLVSLHLVLCLTSLGAHAEGPVSPRIEIGKWKGGAFRDDATKAFSYCEVEYSRPESTTALRLAVGAGAEWSLSVYEPGWKYPSSQYFSLNLSFDGDKGSLYDATKYGDKGASVVLARKYGLLKNLMAAKSLTIGRPGIGSDTFALSDLRNVLNALEACAANNVSPDKKALLRSDLR